MGIKTYKGVDYEPFGKGFTVFFEGDELYFETEDEVKDFIDKNYQEQARYLGV